MKISSKQYALALFDMVKDKKGEDLDKLISKFASIVVSRNDDYKFSQIVSDFETLWYKENSVVIAEIKTARELSQKAGDDILEKLRKITEAKELLVSKSINKDVLGGAVIKYGDRILDISIKNRLDKFKESLIV